MPRNLDHRLEIAFPVLSPALQAKLQDVLETQLADNVKARIILSDGHSERVSPDGRPLLRSQERLYELNAAARDEAGRGPLRSSEPSAHLLADQSMDREEDQALAALRTGERARASAAQETADALLSSAD
jgi:hypothetical protein